MTIDLTPSTLDLTHQLLLEQPTHMSFISDRTSALSLSTGAPVGAIGLDKNPLALTTSQPSRSVLFIDAGVTDSEQLAAGAAAGTQVYRLTAGDAVDQITQVLAGMRDVDSVQIVSHGRSQSTHLRERCIQ